MVRHEGMPLSPCAELPPSNLTACATASMHAAETAHACICDTVLACNTEEEQVPEASEASNDKHCSLCEATSCARRLSARASRGPSCVFRCSSRSREWLEGCERRWCVRHTSESVRRAGAEASGTCATMHAWIFFLHHQC